MRNVFVALAVCAASLLHGQERTLSWTSLDVTAKLESDGTLRVSERHAMRYDGAWNGGERIFRKEAWQELELLGMSYVTSGGRTATMHATSGAGIGLHQYRFDGETLRWRERQSDDPPFRNEERVTFIEYALRNVVKREGDGYLLHHDFAFPDRPGPIESFSAKLELDPAWQAAEGVALTYTRANIRPGESAILRAPLRWTGTGEPQFLAPADTPPPAPLRTPVMATPEPPPPQAPPRPPMREKLPALGAFVLATLALAAWFLRREQKLGRFVPPPHVTPAWLDEHLLVHRAEVVGAAWDGVVGGGEVSALLAILVMEGKIENLAHSRLRLLVPRESLPDYEWRFVDSLFVNGDTIDPETLRAHYASTGFDPAWSLRLPLSRAAEGLVGQRTRAAGCGTVAVVSSLALFFVPFLAVGFALTFLLADHYRSHLRGRMRAAMIPLPLLTGAALQLLFAGDPWLLAISLGASVVGLLLVLLYARSSDDAYAAANLRDFRAARQFLALRLARGEEIDPRWVPYILAYGLAPELDRWSVAQEKPATRMSWRELDPSDTTKSYGSVSAASFGSSSPASSRSRETFGGGGGKFGGAGATGSWAGMAAFAQIVPSPGPRPFASRPDSGWPGSDDSGWSGSRDTGWSSSNSSSSDSSSSGSSSSGSSSSGRSSSDSSSSGGGGGGGW